MSLANCEDSDLDDVQSSCIKLGATIIPFSRWKSHINYIYLELYFMPNNSRQIHHFIFSLEGILGHPERCSSDAERIL